MVQSLRLKVDRELTDDIFKEISEQITPNYLKDQLRRKGVPDRECPECGTTTYELTEPYKEIPTSDLTLQRDGNNFYGLASGAELSDKLLVKAVALKGIQGILKKHGVFSKMDFSDVDHSEYVRLSKYGVILR